MWCSLSAHLTLPIDMHKISRPLRVVPLFGLMIGLFFLAGFDRGPQVRFDGARLSQTVEALRQKTVELERELDSIRGKMDAQERDFEARLREIEERMRRDREGLAGQQSVLRQRVESLEGRAHLAIAEGETIRLVVVEADRGERDSLYRILRNDDS